MKMVCFLGLLGFANFLQAATLTWVGGSGTSWSTAANWSPATAPVSGDALVFSGTSNLTSQNDISGLTLSGISVSAGAGAFTLSGQSVMLSGTIDAQATTTQTLALPLVLVGDLTVNADAGLVILSGDISGTGNVIKTGRNGVRFSGNNTFVGSLTVKVASTYTSYVQGYSSAAFGAATNAITVEDGAWLGVYGGVTISNPITINGDGRLSWNGVLRSYSGTNIWKGQITSVGSRIRAEESMFILEGGVVGNNFYTQAGGSYSMIVFTNQPVNIGWANFYPHGGGVKYLAVTNNTWGRIEAQDRGSIQCGLPNVLPPTKDINWQGDFTLDLNGFDQVCNSIFSSTNKALRYLTSSRAPATLTVNQAQDGVFFGGILQGNVSLVKQGSALLTLDALDHTGSGQITVRQGPLLIKGGNLGNGYTNVIVEQSGRLLWHPTSNSTHLATTLQITTTQGASVDVTNGVTIIVKGLVVDGVSQPSGIYGSASSGATNVLPCLTGNGMVAVIPAPAPEITRTAVWSGAGSDSWVTNSANWADLVVPQFDNTLNVVFGTGGARATFPENVTIGQITLNRAQSNFLLDGPGAINLGKGGIVATSTVSRIFTVSNDLCLIDNQRWYVWTNTMTLRVAGRISSTPIFVTNLAQIGRGYCELYGDNSFACKYRLYTNTCVRLYHSHALDASELISTNASWVELYGGITVTNPVSISATYSGDSSYDGALRNKSGANTYAGTITTSDGRIGVAGGSLRILGGVKGRDLYVSGSPCEFAEKPIEITGAFLAHNGSFWTISVASNKWGAWVCNDSGGGLRFNVADALPPTIQLQFDGGKVLDLNGYAQTIGGLYSTANKGFQSITSAVPAVLTVNQSSTLRFGGCFQGISLVKNGTGTLLLTNTLHAMRGALTVNAGGLSISNGVFGALCTNVTIAASGTLDLGVAALSPEAFVSVAAGGKVRIATGVTNTISYLAVDARMKNAGYYTAQNLPSVILGQGALYVRRGCGNTIILIR